MHKKFFFIIFFLFLLVSIFVGYCVYKNNLLYHYKTVKPGVLYRSGILSYAGLTRVHQLSGYKSIIDLAADSKAIQDKNGWYQSEKIFSATHHVHLYNLYLAPGADPTQAQINQFLRIMQDKHALPVLIHCSQGVMRTNMMVAIYEINFSGGKNQRVFDNLPLFGHTWQRHAVEKQFILNYKGLGSAP